LVLQARIVFSEEHQMRKSLLAAAAAAVAGVAAFAGAHAKDTLVIADKDGFFINGNSFTIVSGKTRSDAPDLIERLNARRLGPGAIIFRSGDALYIAGGLSVPETATLRYGSDRYGRDSGVSAAQAERDWQEWQDSLRGGTLRRGSDRYGSDRYGSDRYGSDRYGRDSGASEAQAERDWQEWQDSLRGGASRRAYGSDRYGSDRYGRDSGASEAQAERDWQEWQDSLRGGASRRAYGSDRDGSDRIYISDPDYVEFRLKKLFEENWSPLDSN
jgi:hypothetical protein